MQRVLSIVTSANTPISVDVNIRDVSSADAVAYRDNVLAICRCATIVKASDEDLRFLFPDIDAITAARHLYQTLPEYSICLLTLGADGVVALSPHGEIACAAERPRAIVDTIGAGDTYFGVFLAVLFKVSTEPSMWDTRAIKAAMQAGAVAATLNIEHRGCQPPSYGALEQRLAALSRK